MNRRDVLMGGVGALCTLLAIPALAQSGGRVLYRGRFAGADRAHRGAGTASIVAGADGRRQLRFADFSVTNGPGLEVRLVARATVTDSSHVTGGETVTLGALKSIRGAQSYALSDTVDLARFQTVVIWCAPFAVLFASAPLAAAGA